MRDAGVRRQGEVAEVGLEFTEEQGEQRRLAAAVGADQTEALARMDLEAGLFEQQLGAASQGDVGKLDQGARAFRSGSKGALL